MRILDRQRAIGPRDLIVLSACAAALTPLPRANAQPDSNRISDRLAVANQTNSADFDGGIITNQVITAAGQDFYQFFASAWRDKNGSERYMLAVHERPTARWGSEVWIEFKQRRVFRTFLPPARAGIRPIGEQAADIVYRSVLQLDAQNLLVNDADLGRDEI